MRTAAPTNPGRRLLDRPGLDPIVVVAVALLVRLPMALAERGLVFDDGVYGITVIDMRRGLAPYTGGFISYSDGIHDDVNKVIWTQLSWNPQLEVREILRDYARCFFGPADVEAVADGILALERNWTGSIRDNGGITGTLALWQQLQDRSQRLGNWRWEMCLLRAWYDAWVRERLLFESALERQAERQLMTASEVGAAAAIALAEQTLQLADSAQPQPQLRAQIVALCAALYDSCRLQTSVTKYQASGAEQIGRAHV